jgi:integrase
VPADKLTDRAIRALKSAPKPYKCFDGRGLYLEVMPNGSKLWRLQYRAVRSRDGKRVQQVLALGRHGSLGDEVTLERARELAAEARARLKVGHDPMSDRRRSRGGQANSLRALAEEWAEKQPWEPRTARRERQILAHWLPALGGLAASSLLPADIRPVLLEIEASGRGDTAHRVRAQIGRVLRYGVVRGICERDVAADLRGLLAPVRAEKYATLTKPEEIGELMRAIESYSGDPSTEYALKILPLVFVRPGELRNARWAEFDLEGSAEVGASGSQGSVPLERSVIVAGLCSPQRPAACTGALWRVPGERMKMRRKNPGEHLVPLSRQTVRLITDLRTITGGDPNGLLFPGLVRGKPISDATLGQALKRLGYGPDRIVPHGFRAMASTQLNEQGFAPDLIELQLAHIDSSVRGIYNRATRLQERREMMQWWADRLDTLRTSAVASRANT